MDLRSLIYLIGSNVNCAHAFAVAEVMSKWTVIRDKYRRLRKAGGPAASGTRPQERESQSQKTKSWVHYKILDAFLGHITVTYNKQYVQWVFMK